MIKVLFYKNNKAPVHEFIKKLDVKDRAKILACLKSIEDLGFDSPRVEFRQIKGKLWEIKIRGVNSGYRIFYVVIQQDCLVLLHAYKKQSQKAPTKEIAIAERRMFEVVTYENDYVN